MQVPVSINAEFLRRSAPLCFAMVLMTGTAWAGPYGEYANATGAGTAVKRDGPCADLPCREGSVCQCFSGQGRVKIYTADSQLPILGGFKIEVSTEDVKIPKAAACGCFIASGYMTIATPRGTLRLPISGPGNLLQPDRRTEGSATFQFASQTTMSAGTGEFKDSHGLGTVSAEFNDPKVKIVLDWGR